MPLVSVIIPVFNTGKFLKRCVESVINQTISDFEIILINDGSTDNSLEICEQLAFADKRVKVIDKENGGVSGARNSGINKANGKYVCFIDSDDAASRDYLQRLTENIKRADLAIGSYSLIENGTTKDFVLRQAKYSLEKFKQSFLTTFTSAYLNCPCNKLFILEIIKKHNIAFPEDMCMGEDSVFVTNYINCCSRINVFSDTIYFYYRMPGKYNPKFLNDRLKMIKNYEFFYKDIKKYSLKVLLLREYLAVIAADISLRNDITNAKEHFTRFITENHLDALILQIKVPFYKKALAYKWLTLLQAGKYEEYLEKYGGFSL